MSSSLQPHESQHARPPCPSPTPRVHPKPCPLSQWCHPTISSSVIPFSSCPQSFPASGSFPMSQLLALGGQSFGVSASASVLPMNIQDWFPFIYYFKDSDLYVHYTLSLAYFPQIVNLTWCKCIIFNLLADRNLLWWLILCAHLPGPWAQTFGQTLFWMFLWVCFLNENNILRKAGCPPQCGWASFCQSKAFIGQRLTSPRKKEFYLQVVSRLNCNISFSVGPQPDGPSEGFGLAFKAAWANSLYMCVCVCVCAHTIFLVHTHAHPIASFLWRTLTNTCMSWNVKNKPEYFYQPTQITSLLPIHPGTLRVRRSPNFSLGSRLSKYRSLPLLLVSLPTENFRLHDKQRMPAVRPDCPEFRLVLGLSGSSFEQAHTAGEEGSLVPSLHCICLCHRWPQPSCQLKPRCDWLNILPEIL